MLLFRMSTLLALLIAIPTVGFSAQLTLDDFLKQVEGKNQSMTASKLIAEGAQERANEGKLIFRPNIFAQAQSTIDKRPTANVNAQGDRTDNNFVTAGILQQFNFGLQGKLGYNFSHTRIYDASPAFLPINNFHDGVATLELSQSLWRNFLGRESRSQEVIITSQAQATKHTENYKIKATLAQAELLYWSLSQIRKVVRVQKESLERAQKIRVWNQNRLKSGLAENSDFLQSDANYKAREYELKSAMQDLKTLQRSVNSLRGVDSEALDEDLESVDSEIIKKLALPSKEELREDTKAALEIQKISKASADLSIEKNKPTFEMYGTYALNGRDPQADQAVTNSFKTNHDTKAIGLRFVAPLDFGTTSDNINGYRKEQIAATQNFQRKLFEQEQQWNDLAARFEDAKVKLSLVEKIEEAQKIKASNERDRLSKGRTVTFQVLNFEQDYAQSELARIQNETNILNIYSQLKIYSAGGTK
ncbi:MAG: TolC family protein [Bacteriovorax sp.]|nr:TolC family protein [Bacteriovorax sp.]